MNDVGIYMTAVPQKMMYISLSAAEQVNDILINDKSFWKSLFSCSELSLTGRKYHLVSVCLCGRSLQHLEPDV